MFANVRKDLRMFENVRKDLQDATSEKSGNLQNAKFRDAKPKEGNACAQLVTSTAHHHQDIPTPHELLFAPLSLVCCRSFAFWHSPYPPGTL